MRNKALHLLEAVVFAAVLSTPAACAPQAATVRRDEAVSSGVGTGTLVLKAAPPSTKSRTEFVLERLEIISEVVPLIAPPIRWYCKVYDMTHTERWDVDVDGDPLGKEAEVALTLRF